MKPSIGRIVHYIPTGSKDAVPAIITSVNEDDGIITLSVFNVMDPVSGAEAHINSAAGPREAGPGQWYWPERV